MSLFFGLASFWSGAVYLNSSMFEPKPQRTSVISSITAFGSTPSRSCMNVPLSSANGPNDIAFLQPTTSVKKSTACFMSGTVMPVWSWPRMPGMESADAVPIAADQGGEQ